MTGISLSWGIELYVVQLQMRLQPAKVVALQKWRHGSGYNFFHIVCIQWKHIDVTVYVNSNIKVVF
jgi:hypothetical protein